MVLDVAGGLAVLVCIHQCHGIGGGGQQIRNGQFGGDLRPLGGEGGSEMRRGGGDIGENVGAITVGNLD